VKKYGCCPFAVSLYVHGFVLLRDSPQKYEVSATGGSDKVADPSPCRIKVLEEQEGNAVKIKPVLKRNAID
jgi:hypothetical protein